MNSYQAEAEALGVRVQGGSRRDYFAFDIEEARAIEHRRVLTCKYAWAIPNHEVIEAIAHCSPLIEIGAGKGYWASLLTEAGADVVCFDTLPPGTETGQNIYIDQEPAFHDVTVGGPEQVALHPGRTLFLCWPPYSAPMAAECLDDYQGERLCFVGEGPGGCTGDDRFWDQMESWETESVVWLPQWYGIRDCLVVYRRTL